MKHNTMATRSTTQPISTKHVETLTHDEAKRKNIPSVEQQSIEATVEANFNKLIEGLHP